jgi:hypothetical protein
MVGLATRTDPLLGDEFIDADGLSHEKMKRRTCDADR